MKTGTTVFEMASFLRVLRYLAMAVATLLPGLYLAVIRFHTQILPANLILSFAQAREGVPFSSVVELVFLELSFELIRRLVCGSRELLEMPLGS